jgi:hypothetical protein
LDVDVRQLTGELQKRFGKRYSVRKVEGKSVRVFTGVRLLSYSFPARSGTGGDCLRSMSYSGYTVFSLSG